MALTNADKAFIAQAIADALVARTAPVVGKASAPVKARTFVPAKRDEHGNVPGGFPCALGCGRTLRTAKRAQSHGVADGGHSASK